MYGFHSDIDPDVIKVVKDNNLDCIQYMPGGRITFSCPDCTDKILLCLRNSIDVVFHSPLCTYVVSDKELVLRLTRQYFLELDAVLSKVCSVVGDRLFKVVIHAGSTSNKSTSEQVIKSFCDFILNNTRHIILCIENDVGSKSGSRVGSVSFLNSIVSEINNPRIKLCIDTNHSWGHPKEDFDVTDISHWDAIIHNVGVIHLNCIPSICARYAMRDRHSEFLIEDSGESTKWLSSLYKRNYDVSYITERSSYILSIKDYDYLRGNNI